MAAELSTAPVLSTPDDHILEVPATETTKSTLSDEALRSVYEVERTVSEIQSGGWKRIALQFPDDMLVDAPRVSEALGRGLQGGRRIYVLGDTSYSSCCVDEVAAEHADAEVVVHYGRACLSPTSRLPVIYVYTSRELDITAALAQFEGQFSDKLAKVVVMADLTYQNHVEPIVANLRERGYQNVLGTEVLRDPTGFLPNRRIAGDTELADDTLRTYALFHISDPPSSLLLALSTRLASLHVLSTSSPSGLSVDNPTLYAAGLLRRRFARVLSLASAGVIGILVNTLSVTNSLASIDTLRAKVAAAGKKSYTIVVGRLNPAKLANFAEVEGWVIVGCWESGLISDEQEKQYWRPVVTPFELEVALMDEEERVWGSEWWGGIEKLKLDEGTDTTEQAKQTKDKSNDADVHIDLQEESFDVDGVDGEESMPPEYDLRTGKLVSHSRPMRLPHRSSKTSSPVDNGDSADGMATHSDVLVKRTAAGEIASINGVLSPGAEFLRSKRTWQGLGSDFADQEQESSTVVEEGRSGIARGYRVGDDTEKH
jgi:diphthamide biosynthesis protein 2